MGQILHQSEAVPSRSKATLYQDVTDRIIRELEQGRVPWVQPWEGASASLGLPKNAISARHYSGINILILWDAVITRGFGAQQWLTFRQALGLGGHVRKGERGTTICYADRFIPKGEQERAREQGDEPSSIPFLKRFTVFNVEQCEGLPQTASEPPREHCEAQTIPAAEATIAATAADFRIGGGEAFYHRGDDYIRVPPQTSFFESINYYRTCLHELGHWTAHPARLARDLTGRFGSTGYAREELVAEMTSAFLCAQLSIQPTVRHADYIGSWLEVLRGDSKAIFQAASIRLPRHAASCRARGPPPRKVCNSFFRCFPFHQNPNARKVKSWNCVTFPSKTFTIPSSTCVTTGAPRTCRTSCRP